MARPSTKRFPASRQAPARCEVPGSWLAEAIDPDGATVGPGGRGGGGFGSLDRLLTAEVVDAGATIAAAGTPAERVHLVRSGTVELRRAQGRRHVIVGTLGPGGVIGDVPAILRRPHHLDAVAVDRVTAWSIGASDLLTVVASRPALADRWLAGLAGRLADADERVCEVLAGHLDHRVATCLLRRAGPDQRVDLTQAQLAGLLGVQRSSVNEAIRRLEKRRLIRRGYGHVVIEDPAALRLLLDG